MRLYPGIFKSQGWMLGTHSDTLPAPQLPLKVSVLCRMTTRQFRWTSGQQGGPYIIYDVSTGLVYVDRR